LRGSGVGGVVGVSVIIDESGTVVSAEADLSDQRVRKTEDGSTTEPIPLDPMLREAAENAARQALFSPTLLNNAPVRIKGKIIYNFVSGDTQDTTAGKSIAGGVLNGRASSLPPPAYPAAAKAVGAQGSVSVQITLDEEGNVVSAVAVSGHPLLRAASEKAALDAKFAPTLLSGQPVKVSGVLTYYFVP
jgi:TonB family protein